jgi:hypothetical protein
MEGALMDERQAQRIEALRLYSKLARTSRFQRHKEKRWGRAAAINVVPALESDRVVDVQERVQRAGGAADVVVYWPDEGRIVVTYTAHAGRTVDRESIFGIDPVNVHEDSTMGMLVSLIGASGPIFTTSRADVLALSAK